MYVLMKTNTLQTRGILEDLKCLGSSKIFDVKLRKQINYNRRESLFYVASQEKETEQESETCTVLYMMLRLSLVHTSYL